MVTWWSLGPSASARRSCRRPSATSLCRHDSSVRFVRADAMLRTLQQSRLDNTPHQPQVAHLRLGRARRRFRIDLGGTRGLRLRRARARPVGGPSQDTRDPSAPARKGSGRSVSWAGSRTAHDSHSPAEHGATTHRPPRTFGCLLRRDGRTADRVDGHSNCGLGLSRARRCRPRG
jgi:hypothetical protein